METHKAFQQDASTILAGSGHLGSSYDRLKVRDIMANYDQLKAAIAKRHEPTAEHSIRVRIHATSLGFACRLTGNELTALSIAAEIHDIGKLQVPTGILDKPGPLTDADWAIVKRHSVWGAKIAALAFPSMPDVARCVLLHHERLDGTGYPNGLAGYEIPILPRIMAVADAFAALTEDRTFRAAYSDVEALRILMQDETGKYDQQILELLAKSQVAQQV